MELKEFSAGGYAYLTGIPAFSSGVVALAGHEVVHAVLLRPLPWRAGFDLVARHLETLGRPRQALCAMELRSPEPFTAEGFAAFNKPYMDVLVDWQIMTGDDNPVARTNVAPVVAPPESECLHAFSYTVASAGNAATFVVAGAADVMRQDLGAPTIVREGETSADAMREKAAAVMAVMAARLEALGQAWADVTAIDVYCAHDVHGHLASTILEPAGPAAGKGVCWHLSHPPIQDLAYEIDMRGVRQELIL